MCSAERGVGDKRPVIVLTFNCTVCSSDLLLLLLLPHKIYVLLQRRGHGWRFAWDYVMLRCRCWLYLILAQEFYA